jgi:UDP-galactopyranose mutase
MKFNYLIVGAGITGGVLARELTDAGKSVLVIDKRNHIAGNCYTESINNINVHKYGPHIFHTSDKRVWDYVNRFTEFNRYTAEPVANYHGKIYNLPFNMNTFNKLWGVVTPEEAMAKIEETKFSGEPSNLEEQALTLVGEDIYRTLVKEYTEKQWGRDCRELPAFIIKRLPVRFTYNNNYFNDRYQGIPIGGYTQLFERLLDGIEVRLQTEFNRGMESLAERTIYTGTIDSYFNYSEGRLAYRTLRFESEELGCANFQGLPVMNYTSHAEPFTRITEHKHFEPENPHYADNFTIITKEYSKEYSPGDEPYYPVNDAENSALYARYRELAKTLPNVIFGGRLGEYKYYDMDKAVARAFELLEECGVTAETGV